MQDTLLKKEFNQTNVQRLRNLISGNENKKTKEQSGYNKIEYDYKEGDIWEENGKKWTIHNGIKQNIIINKEIKKELKLPLFCPNCEQIMNKRLDSQYYPIHKTCFNCVIDKEHTLKKEGKWEEYHKKIHNEEIDAKINEFLLWLESAKNENLSFVTEDGDVEDWFGGLNLEDIEKNKNNIIKYLKGLKK